MAKKPSAISLGFSVGIFLVVIHALRTIAVWLFPNVVASVLKKLTYNAIYIQPPVLSVDSFLIGLVALFAAGFVCGFVFAIVYKWFE